MNGEWGRRCPRGHTSVDVGTNRFYCHACARRGSGGSYPNSDLVELGNGGGRR